jgi:Tol biopolymer transport system component/DNA-binding winged helix-turn-helix (wHTH) protein
MGDPLINRFRLDLVSYRLFDEEHPVRLERQAMDLLILLARRPGELATRDEIAATLWSPDVHVDVDQSINRLIRRLRLVLHDDPEKPHFIETVVGKGYRFVGAIDVVDRTASRPETRLAPPDPNSVVERSAPQPQTRPFRTPWGWIATSLGVCAAVTWVVLGVPGAHLPPPVVNPLTAYVGDEQYPTLSPDGRQVAFAWNGEQRDNWDIYVLQVGSSARPLHLTTDPAEDTTPTWSPEGSEIAFARRSGDQFSVYVISPLGGPERKVAGALNARSPETFTSPSWSPDGTAVLTTDFDRKSQSTQIILVHSARGERRTLLSSRDSGAYGYPAIAPNGKTLAFEWCTLANICDVRVVDIDENSTPRGEPRTLTRDGHLARGLAWARDSQSLVYGDGLRIGLRRIFVSGAPSERLELAGVGAMFPAISQAGDRLAYVQAGWDMHLWRFGAGGSAGPEGFLLSTLVDINPQFSRDGAKIVFGSERAGNGRQIWVANADGSNPVAVTEPTRRAQGAPRWSPDGRFIVYDGQLEDGHRHVYVVDAGSGVPHRVTLDSWDESMPSWSRDGHWIYLGSARAGRQEIWRVPVDAGSGAAEQQLTTAGGLAAFESEDRKAILYTKRNDHDSPLFEKSLSGDPERVVIDSVYRSDFVPAGGGVYYVAHADPRRADIFELRFLDLHKGQTTVLNRFESLDVVGLTVSPDCKTIVTSGVRPSAGADLMLMKNFR